MTGTQLIVILQNDGNADGGVAAASSRLADALRRHVSPVRVLESSLWGGKGSLMQRREHSLIWNAAKARGLQSKLARSALGAKRRAAKELVRVAPDETTTVVIAMEVLAAEVLAVADYRSARTLAQYHSSHSALSGGRDLHRLTRAAQRLDQLLVLTPADAAAFIATGTPATDVPNIIDWPLAEAATRPVQRRVVAVGRLVKGKNFQRLISAWGAIATQYPNWSLDICGAGPERDALNQQIHDGGLDGVISLRGACDDLQAEFGQYDFLALSSDYEGLPLVIMEAMSQGLPVVATDCSPGVRLQIEESGAGWLTALSVEGLTRGLIDAIRECEATHTKAESAVEYAKRFTPDVVLRRWMSVIDDIEPRQGTPDL